MKMNNIGKLIFGAALCMSVALPAFAQQSIPGKIYVAEVAGSVTCIADGKVIEVKKGVVQAAPGARVETAAGAHVVLIYSNGTSVYVDEKTILEIREFIQGPFPPGIDTSEIEPSISKSVSYVRQGRVVVTTNRLAAGSSMVFLTPECQVNIRGKDVVIEARERQTTVSVIRGDVTVIPADATPGAAGHVLHDGQMAVITRPAGDNGAETVRIEALTAALINDVSAFISANERSQKIVVFETVTNDAGVSQIQAKDVVPAVLPTDLTVSPSSLRTGG
jgi:hypothetical protein